MSPVFGVGSSFEDASRFWQAREDEYPLASMGGTNVRSSDARPLRVVPERGQIPEYSGESA
jgi:hypothetical protein